MIEGNYPLTNKALADWQCTALCDVCRRYMQIHAYRGSETIDGTTFCACACRGELGECDWPATPELVDAWRAWAEQRAAQWQRVQTQNASIRMERYHAEEHEWHWRLPIQRGPALHTGRVIG